MGRRLDDKDYLEEAMAALAGLPEICKILLLRVDQIEQRAPSLNGLVSPMGEQVAHIMGAIGKAQQAHTKIWSKGFMK